jgi:hypothetical protein
MLGALLLASTMALAAPKVSVCALRCDAPGNDNQARNLNREYVVFKNNTNMAVRMGGWRVHDEGRIHTYRIPTNFRLGAGKSVTLHSGRGANSPTHLYGGAPTEPCGTTTATLQPLGTVLVKL